ncbi:MAG: hypothetical protein JXR70_09450 [Spirochaetales bacterium]|nr:hypothetical protein [Spirochaetales bacterium]
MSTENSKWFVVSQNFLRFSEILINIFFRIIESGIYSDIAPNEQECINRMIEKRVVPESRDWELFLRIKNQLQNPDSVMDVNQILSLLNTTVLDFSDKIMQSIQLYLDNVVLNKKTD